ncbi:DNA repair protein RadB, partial [Candidatus Pacearchaeota archaeon CG11_big_fil_rev_8_21_14_0_20_30_13]
MAETKISFGNYELDKFFEGGYENDIITTIYGPAGCGKTNLCMLATVSQTKQGKKVIFMDTEGGFSVDRFKQIAEGDYSALSDKVLLLKPTSFDEQKKAFEILSKELNKTPIGLIIVDGMTMLYRLELSKDKDENKI